MPTICQAFKHSAPTFALLRSRTTLSYAFCSCSMSFTRMTPMLAAPDTGLMTEGKPTWSAAACTSLGALMRALRGVGRPAWARQVRVQYCSRAQRHTGKVIETGYKRLQECYVQERVTASEYLMLAQRDARRSILTVQAVCCSFALFLLHRLSPLVCSTAQYKHILT
jgi:hypothetical protein